MSDGTRLRCWSLPSERIVMLYWLRAQSPTGWRLLWARITKAWRA